LAWQFSLPHEKSTDGLSEPEINTTLQSFVDDDDDDV
jgi:hypothetical protein